MRTKTLLTVLVFMALALSIGSLILQFLIIPQSGLRQTITAKATSPGYTAFCINRAPSLSYPCNTTIAQDVTYFCQLNATDPDVANTHAYSQVFISGGQVIFNVTPDGNISFTPDNDDVGNYTVRFTATDSSGCGNNQGNVTLNLTVSNVNDPPYLIQALPDVEFPANTSISAFFLNDHFEDPDGDPMNYTSTALAQITVTIHPSSEVVFTSTTCDAEETIRFFAEDPLGATGQSNFVEVKVDCEEAQAGTGTDGSGGGGGSGGGASNVCRSEYECQDWFECLPTGFQWQRCYDMQGCEEDKYFKRECEYKGAPPACIENWLCEEWGNCLPNSTQYRTCEDLNNCRTTIVQPPLSQTCRYIPSCNDGIQNGNETGIDCGGQCAACALLEQPAPIDTAWLASWILIILIVSILLVAGALRYYRAEIAQALATLGFLVKHRIFKDILLEADQRKAMFEQIIVFEDKLKDSDTLEPTIIYDELSTLIRTYFQEALILPLEMIKEEVTHRCDELSVRPHTKDMLLGLFGKLEVIEQAELDFDEYFVLVTLEDLRTTVCMTSDYKQDEVARPMYDIPITDEMSFYDEMFVRMINVLRAVQFNQLSLAKKEYIQLLQIYEPLTLKEKEDIYPTVHWTFSMVKISADMTGAKVVDKSKLTEI